MLVMEKKMETTRTKICRVYGLGFMGLGFRAAIAARSGFQVCVRTV